jgi:predicted DNA-binding transcriptional regulator AlpA
MRWREQEKETGMSASKPNYRKIPLAQHLGVTSRTLDNWIEKGQIPRPDFFVGRIPQWRHATIEKWERQSVARSSSQTIKESTTADGEAA